VGSNDLKRVGLIFTEEGAKDFKKTLQDINIEMNKNYNQFKLTQSQWDNSTKSTEKLKAQQEYLTNAYEIQSDKVNVLKMQLADLENAENKNTTAIKKKQNELTNAEIKLKNYESKLKDVQTQLTNTGKKLEEWGEKVEKSGKKIENAGKKLSAFSAASISALTLSAKSAIDFEDAFAGVEKTVDGTKEQMEELKQGIRDMAKEIPSSTTEISAVAEAAGQLGIKTEDILSFTRVMIDLGNSTNLSAEEAALSLAKFANITKMSAKDYDKLGATIVDLGNNFKTTEADIVAMAQNLASAGTQVGMSQSDILSLATALSSVGLEAQAGGTAFSKALINMQLAVETNSKSLKDWADVAGMSVDDFSKLFKEDATKALQAFIEGLSKCGGETKSAIKVLDDMGITETRMRDALLRSANASETFTDAIKTGNKAWQDNTALTNEANKRYATLKSKIKMAISKLKDIAITLGDKLMPSIEKVIEGLGKWIDKFSTLSDKQVDMIVKIGLIVAAIGPLVTIIGKVTSVIGGTIKGIGTFTQAIGVARGKITSTSEAVNGLAKVFTVVTSPVGLACTAIGLAVAGIAIAVNESQKKTKEAFENMSEGVSDFYNGLKSAEGYLDSFNTTMFATNEEQQKLQTQMDEVQKGITDICKTASDERRGYTQEEITQLDEYFKKLRELKDREIQIQQQIAGAITQQAVTNAETFQGSLDEYKVQSQEWIATAQKQSEQTKQLIEQGTIEEVALLNQRYGEQATMQNGAYATEYNNIMAQKQAKIDVANEEVAKISEAYANGYLERASQNDGFYTKLQEYNKKIEEENNRHNDVIQNIEDGNFNKILGIKKSKESEAWKHYENQKKIWEEMYKNMSEEQAKELGVWLEQVAQTEMYGGKISDETQKMVNFIMDSYDNMPDDTKKVMKRTMEGMLNGMKDEEPSLFAKAKGIADGILNRLRKAFDIHSPSRKTRAIFKNVMKRNGKRNRNRRK
jgi:TP901 family phage tail tape measure protein